MDADWKDHIPHYIRISDKPPITKTNHFAGGGRPARKHPRYDEIVQAFLDGVSQTKIARDFSVHHKTLKKIKYELREKGLLEDSDDFDYVPDVHLLD